MPGSESLDANFAEPMVGLSVSNEFISRDEGLHCDFACFLYNDRNVRLSDEDVWMFCFLKNQLTLTGSWMRFWIGDERSSHVQAVQIEHEFIRDALPVHLIGMNAAHMQQYICFVADRLLNQLGHARRYVRMGTTSDHDRYGVTNPFDWMVMISMQGKTNFFERRVADYSKSVKMDQDQEDEHDVEF